LDECQQEMAKHKNDHLSVDCVTEDARPRAKRIHGTFSSIGCSGLPHPGKRVASPNFCGEIVKMDPDFIYLLNVWMKGFFTRDFPKPSSPLGRELSTELFVGTLLNYVKAFSDSRGMAIGLREGFVRMHIGNMKKTLSDEFRQEFQSAFPDSYVMDPVQLSEDAHALLTKKLLDYKLKLKPFRMTPEEEKEEIQDFTSALEGTITDRIAANQEQLDNANQKTIMAGCQCLGGCAAWATVPHILIGAGAAGGCVVHLQKKEFQGPETDLQRGNVKGLW